MKGNWGTRKNEENIPFIFQTNIKSQACSSDCHLQVPVAMSKLGYWQAGLEVVRVFGFSFQHDMFDRNTSDAVWVKLSGIKSRPELCACQLPIDTILVR